MVVVANRFRRRPGRLRADQAAPVREAMLMAWRSTGGAQEVDEFFGSQLDFLDGLTAPPVEKGFVMAFMQFVEAVSDHLSSSENISRPLVAVRLWLRCIGRLDRVTNEILATRNELAASLGVPAREVSRVMSELVRIDAVRRETGRAGAARGAGVVRYFLNERVANHFPEPERSAKMGSAPVIKLAVDNVPPSERRPRARSFVLPVL